MVRWAVVIFWGEILLDPEAGGSHRRFDQLVRLGHPGSAARFYLGVEGSLVCLIASTDTESLHGRSFCAFSSRFSVCGEYAELITFGVGEHAPANVAITRVEECCAGLDQGFHIASNHIDVDSILRRLSL